MIETLWAVAAFAFVAAVVVLAAWVFVAAPLVVPRRAGGRLRAK